ncbi:MAG: SCP2 domain-containing protein [Methylophilaceae bacterium]
MKLKQINITILNHLLNQQPWARDQLCRYAGKNFRLAVPPITLDLCIDSNGEFIPREENTALEAMLSLPAAAALQFALSGKLDASQLNISGDTELAQGVGQILRNLSWDMEEDLSHVMGDVPAHTLMNFGKKILAEGQRKVESVAGMFAEFWQEEDPLIVKQRHLEGFTADVDKLRDDVERLEKRTAKLATDKHK